MRKIFCAVCAAAGLFTAGFADESLQKKVEEAVNVCLEQKLLYLQKPFKALATEEAGYPLLKQILQKMARLMSEGKLKLKADKARKAEQTLNGILKRDSLANLYKRCVEVATREKQILNSIKMEEIKVTLSEYQEHTKQLKARKSSVEAHEAVKERGYNETLNKIGSHKRAIEKNVYSSLGIKVQIL